MNACEASLLLEIFKGKDPKSEEESILAQLLQSLRETLIFSFLLQNTSQIMDPSFVFVYAAVKPAEGKKDEVRPHLEFQVRTEWN